MANSTGQSPSSSCSSRPAAAAAVIPVSSILSSPPSSSSSLLTLQGPCAACKFLRRRCSQNCVLAPYFPRTEPLKFIIAHKVFGAGNIIKMLQELPNEVRTDAVNSMVYEANARIRDPVYGCTGAICQLQKQISDLQAELAKAKAEIFNVQSQNDNLFSIISTWITTTSPSSSQQHHHHHHDQVISSAETHHHHHDHQLLQTSNNTSCTWFLDDQINAYAAGIDNTDYM